jgi:hypothetical protein
MSDVILAWHFTANTLRDGSPLPPLGEWLEYDGPIDPCCSGLHGSVHPFDALQYAPGPLLHRVELAGTIVPHGNPIDKYAASRRRILASHNASDTLRCFARQCASDVLHLWDAPRVVKDYLSTGDESLREAAGAAAWAAARDAAGAAAWAAAWAASWAAARDAQSDQFALMVNDLFATQALAGGE